MRLRTEKDPHEQGKGGKSPEPGKYHAMIKSVDNSHGKHAKSIPVEFEILTGTVPGQEGKTTTEFFYYDPHDPKDFAIDRLSRLAWAAGLMEAGTDADVDLRQAIGRHVVIELFEDSYEKNGETKKTTKLSWKFGAIWPLGDDEVADVPKNEDALKLAITAKEFVQHALSGTQVSSNSDPFGDL